MRIKQQNNITSKRSSKRKRSTMAVDDSVKTTFQSRMNEVFADYPVQDLIMNSDMTRVHQSMTPTTTLCPVGMPTEIDTGVSTNSVAVTSRV